jgi:hypothetical protein
MKTELFNLVKLGTEIGCFKLQNNQNMSRRFKSLVVERRIVFPLITLKGPILSHIPKISEMGKTLHSEG